MDRFIQLQVLQEKVGFKGNRAVNETKSHALIYLGLT